MDVRKSMKVSAYTKQAVKDVQKQIGFKNESETIAYLALVHTWALAKMPTGIYREAIALAKDVHKQIDMNELIDRARKTVRAEIEKEENMYTES